MSLQAGALVALLWIADRIVGAKVWPCVRLAAWTLVLAKLLLPPTLTSPVGLARLIDLGPALPMAIGDGGDPLPASAGAPFGLLLAFGLWALGALLLGSLRVLRIVRFRRGLERDAGEVEPRVRKELARAARRIGLRRLPRVVSTSRCDGPAVYGVLRPVLLLPAGFGKGSPEETRFALLHELAHLRRRDPLLASLASAIEVLYWFHPLVRLATRRIAALLELACDESVAGLLREETPRYRDALLLAASRWIGPSPAGLAFHGRPSTLLARLRWLERPGLAGARLRRTAAAFVAAGMLAFVLPMGAFAEAPPSPRGARASSPVLSVPLSDRQAALDTLRRASRGERVSCFHLRQSVLLLSQEGGLPSRENP
jgi:BlaR1 peptidase M56